jgi:hypothetical protein
MVELSRGFWEKSFRHFAQSFAAQNSGIGYSAQIPPDAWEVGRSRN